MAAKRTHPKRKDLPKKIAPFVWAYIYLLEAHGVPVEHAYVFGSWAKGKQHRWSDIDVAIVSPRFSDWEKTNQLLYRSRYDDLIDIEPHGFHPKDFFSENSILGNEIKKTGIRVK